MSNECAIQAEYVTFAHTPTRKVMKIVLEIPEEAGEDFIAKFGVPMGGASVPVALARLAKRPEAPKAPKPKRPFEEMTRAEQAGMLCGDPAFQGFLEEHYAGAWGRAIEAPPFSGPTEYAARAVRQICKVTSRADIDRWSPQEWDGLVKDFRAYQTETRYADELERVR